MPGTVILFDVNETLLDVSALDPWFDETFGDPAARKRWFMELEVLWHGTIATGEYRDFPTLARAALRMRGWKEERELPADAGDELVEQIKSLPPHEDAAPALERLRAAGHPIAALTNGTLAAARQQLGNAGLLGFFDEVLSADEVERFKPAPEPYAMALDRLGARAGDSWMLAAHAWDIAGAQAAGLRTGFVARPGKVLNPAGAKPDIAADDLAELVQSLLGRL